MELVSFVRPKKLVSFDPRHVTFFLQSGNVFDLGIGWSPGCQRQFQNGGLLSQIWTSFKTNYTKIAGTLEAETSENGKTWSLLAIGEDKKVSQYS